VRVRVEVEERARAEKEERVRVACRHLVVPAPPAAANAAINSLGTNACSETMAELEARSKS
jgi:hypothetical protein